MNCKYKVNIKDIQYNYKVKMEEIQSKYKFNIFCRGYDDSDIKGKIDDMYNAWPKVTGEGEEITLNDTVNASMPLGLKGNTSQVQTTQSANLFDAEYYNNNSLYTTETYKYTLARFKGNRTLYVKSVLKEGKEKQTGYYLAISNSNGKPYQQDAVTAYAISNGNTTAQAKDFTGVETLYINVYPNNADLSVIFDNYNIMVSTDDISYVPFVPDSPSPDYPQEVHVVTGDNEVVVSNGDNTQSTTYPINLPEGMFMGWIGNYQDYFYKQDKKWYLQKKIGKEILDGTSYPIFSVSSNNNVYYAVLTKSVNTFLSVPPISNYYKGGNPAVVAGRIYVATAKNLVMCDTGTSLTTKALWNAWLKDKYDNGNPVKLYYVLATPETIEITDTTLISQLDAIEKAESYSGQTNISQTNEDMPFIITASTLKDLSSLGTSTVNTLNTASVNRLQTPSISPSLNLNNLELNNEDLELNNLEETIEETPEEE